MYRTQTPNLMNWENHSYIYSFLLVVSINYLATSNNTTQKVMELIIYVRPI